MSRGGEFVRGGEGRSFLIARKFPHKFYRLVRLEIDRRSSLETQCIGLYDQFAADLYYDYSELNFNSSMEFLPPLCSIDGPFLPGKIEMLCQIPKSKQSQPDTYNNRDAPGPVPFEMPTSQTSKG